MSICLLVRVSGAAIEKLCALQAEAKSTDRGTLVRAARCLLSSVTKVLLLADTVVVKQLILSKDKVSPAAQCPGCSSAVPSCRLVLKFPVGGDVA